MPRATIQGEFHLSQRDAAALLDRDLAAHDALFVEGRDNRADLAVDSPGEALLLVGALEAFAIQALVNGAVDRLRGGRSPRARVGRIATGTLPVHDDIDVEVGALHALAPRSARLLAGAVVVGLLALLVVPTPLVTPRGTLSYRFVLVCWTAGVPLVYLLCVLVATDGRRDGEMADRIDAAAARAGYERVLVSVGDRHVEGVAAGLRERGWEVRTHHTRHRLLSRFAP